MNETYLQLKSQRIPASEKVKILTQQDQSFSKAVDHFFSKNQDLSPLQREKANSFLLDWQYEGKRTPAEPQRQAVIDQQAQGQEKVQEAVQKDKNVFNMFKGAQAGQMFGPGGMAVGAAIGRDANAFMKAHKALTETKFHDYATAPAEMIDGLLGKLFGLDLESTRNLESNIGQSATVAKYALPVAAGFATGGMSIPAAAGITALAGGTGEVVDNVVNERDQSLKDHITEPLIAGAIEGTLDAATLGAFKVGGAAIRGGGKFFGRMNRGLQRASADRAAKKLLSEKAQEVIKSGFGREAVEDIIASSADDVTSFRYMMDIAENVDGKLGAKVQPKQVVGRNLLKPVNHIIEANKKLNTQLKDVVAKLPSTADDITDLYRKVEEIFDVRGITIKADGSLRNTGALPDGDMKMYRTIYNQLRPNGKGNVIRTPQKMHTIRQKLFAEGNIAKARLQSFSDAASRDIETIRSILLDKVATHSDAYRTLNTDIAKNIPVIQDFAKLMGHKGSLETLNARSLKAGEVATRVLGNASSRPLELIENVIKRADVMGFEMSDDIIKQMAFSDLLEETFGITQKTGFAGSTQKGVNAALDLGSTRGLARTVGGIADTITGRTKPEKIRALKQLLQELDVPVNDFKNVVDIEPRLINYTGLKNNKLRPGIDVPSPPPVVDDVAKAETKADVKSITPRVDRATSNGISIDNMASKLDSLSDNNKANVEAIDIIKKAANNPNAKVKVYRATTNDSIISGDWVFLTKSQADDFSKSKITKKLKEGYKVLSAEANASDIDWTGKNLEFVYKPSKIDDVGSNTNSIKLEQKALNEKAIKTIIEDRNNGVKGAENDILIDSDHIKSLHPRFNGDNAPEIHPLSSKAMQEVYKEALKDPSIKKVKFTAGGSGSGKSEVVLKNITGDGAIIMDGTLANFEKATKNIQQAIDAGKEVELHSVFAPVKVAQKFSAGRSERVVPIDVLEGKHVGFRTSIRDLAKKFESHVSVNFNWYSNGIATSDPKKFKSFKVQDLKIEQLDHLINDLNIVPI
jgi:hypothetical protein